jgi:Flp pilus assembly pilin Flp
MKKFLGICARLGKDDSGITSMEYALLAVLIAVVCMSAVISVGVQTRTFYSQMSSALVALGW